MRLSPLLMLALPVAALAAPPMEFTHQGRLFDAAGQPLVGAHDLSLSLHDAPSGGGQVWMESFSGVLFQDGYYAVDLGQGNPLELSTFANAAQGLWLELQVDTGPALPQRLPLQSVPYALIASHAEVASSVDGGPVNATELTVNGSPVVSADGTIDWSAITGAPQQLGSLQCSSTGDVATWNGGAWACGAPSAHEHSAEQLTSGTLSLDVLPIGTSANTIARGNHTHTALDVDFGANDPTNPLNHNRYTDDEARAAVGAHYTDDQARAAVGSHYTDQDAILAVGPHTARYTDPEAIAAVGPHTPAYTDDMAIAAVGPHTPRYTNAMARAAVGDHTIRYTDAEAITAVGPHTPEYTDAMAIAAVGPHTPKYTNAMAIAAVGPHTPEYTDAMAKTAVGPHTPEYTDSMAIAAVDATGAYLPAGGGAMTGNLDLGGNALKGVSNFWWGRMSAQTGDWSTSDGTSGTLVVPAAGNDSCDSSFAVCMHTFSATQHRLIFKIPAWDADWWGGADAVNPGAMCWATSSGDNESVSHESFGRGAIAVGTDGNGHCTNNLADISNCAYVDVLSDSLSHDIFGVFCYLP